MRCSFPNTLSNPTARPPCRYVALCCVVLQCVEVPEHSAESYCAGALQLCCSVLQCVAVCCSVLQCVAVCCGVLQCVAICCSVLQCNAMRCSFLNTLPNRVRRRSAGVLQCVALCCSALQFVPIVAGALQCVAVCCSMLKFLTSFKSYGAPPPCSCVLQCVAVR